MALNAKNIKAPKGNRVPQPALEPDVYPGRVVQVLDLGVQPQKPYQGQDKPPCHEIMLTYELAEEFMKDENGDDLEDKPRWISETLPFYGLQADKAKSTKRYAAFDPNGDFDGDFAKCVGVPVNITIVNNVVGDKTYENVGNVAAMSAKKAEKVAELVNKPKVFDLDNPDLDTFNAMPEWLREKIKSNLNYNGSALQTLLGKGAAKPAPAKAAKKAEQEDEPEEDNAPY